MISRPLNRVTPALPAAQMQTFAFIAPAETHWRKATCAEVECGAYLNGWTLNTAGLAEQDVHLAKHAGREFVATEGPDGGETLTFAAGQPCFRASAHRLRLDREEIFLKHGGDWRGDPRRERPTTFSGPDAWADAMRTHLDQFQS